MTTISIILIFIGILIFLFSFVLKIGKSNVEKDFNEAIRIFEENRQKEEQEAEQETVEILDNDTDNEDDEDLFVVQNDFSSDDEDIKDLMNQSRDFLKFVSIVIIVIGVVVYFIWHFDIFRIKKYSDYIYYRRILFYEKTTWKKLWPFGCWKSNL